MAIAEATLYAVQSFIGRIEDQNTGKANDINSHKIVVSTRKFGKYDIKTSTEQVNEKYGIEIMTYKADESVVSKLRGQAYPVEGKLDFDIIAGKVYVNDFLVDGVDY
ncbi:hypothetical protein [Anaerotalea alkaliphila]|uniref:Uncharacterized protein n=1 Tax=Anaerotalea alkaliphila TaxID=2662126 RepID=A0A7X5KNE1_9FIRM|nr:hypothetical protein [Anaerotalea alkaliphila]NDL67698.1 hypothetical protein [Anaerotalea alkaliphila]